MVHLVQRIIVNSYGWTRPSPGRLGPLGEGKYVRENGFDHEDWNFNLDLAIDGHIYGYAYYEPSNAKAGDQFQMAFVTYTGHRWHLSGFYFNAEFVNTAPTSKAILNAKVKDLLALGSTNSLGKSWIRLKEERMRQKLEDEAQWLRWKVDINNVMVLPHPVAIPEHLFSTSNYRITRPTEVDAATFNALRTLATRTSSPDEDDAFPEGREVLLRHKAKERSPAVVQAAKAKFCRCTADSSARLAASTSRISTGR